MFMATRCKVKSVHKCLVSGDDNASANIKPKGSPMREEQVWESARTSDQDNVCKPGGHRRTKGRLNIGEGAHFSWMCPCWLGNKWEHGTFWTSIQETNKWKQLLTHQGTLLFCENVPLYKFWIISPDMSFLPSYDYHSYWQITAYNTNP